MDHPAPDDLSQRLRRIYAAVELGEEHDMGRLKPIVVTSPGFFGVSPDFSGGLSAEQMETLAYSLIQNVANVVDHAKKWTRRNNKDPKQVDEEIKKSFAIQIMIDLSNNDKHNYPPRNGGQSKRSPRLLNPRRILQMTTRPEKGSTVGLTFGQDGSLRILGDGSAKAIISGDILDETGNRIGSLDNLAQQAIENWEQILDRLGALPAAGQIGQ